MKIDGKNPEFAIGNFEGEVVQFFGDFKYKKGQAKITGESQDALMSSFEILGPGGRARVVVWDSPGLAGKIKKGAYVEIENGQKRGKEIHINSSGRLLIAGIKQQRPTIEKIEIANDESQNQGLQKLFVFASGSKIFQFPSLEEAAICIGGGPIPQGIEPQTIIELKKKDWIGKPVPQEWEKYCKKI
jgi:hypothetical protein